MCTIESRLSTDSSVHWSNNGVVPLYAGAGRFAYAQSLQAPDKMFWAAGSHGVFKSTDRGLNWGQRQSGIPADALARSLTLRQADQTLFVFVDGDPAIGLLKSGDDGETFVAATADMVAAGLASAGGAPMHVDSLWQPSLADACRTGLTLCHERCVDTRSDRANCGACANACSAEETCTSTGCVLSGCNGGQRAGLVDPARWPKIAACAGRFADALDKGGGAELCAPGWHVCTSSDASLRSLGYLAATSFPGCFAADASDDSGRCGVLACSVYASDDVAGAGADCALLAGAAWPGVGGCLADGRVEAISGSAERLGCWQVPGVDGVLCCQD